MRRLSTAAALTTLFLIPAASAQAQTEGTYITTADVERTEADGLARLRENANRTISDLMIRHVDVGDEQLGVAVVQRTKRAPGGPLRGIAHVKLDEIYYVLSGSGTMVSGGPMTDISETNSALLGPMQSGLMQGGTSQKMGPGDMVIVPKGVPHSWSEITTDTISYLIFRTDPEKVMELK
ncbi:MAG: cupin domain-containing protein [Vicinamibacterales bacterium]|jgi:mannose-6-phosphate isomerase-like protein (cupin superfamily)|nr:cupin domain-containing protein [Vicinamibacterales bacterium]